MLQEVGVNFVEECRNRGRVAQKSTPLTRPLARSDTRLERAIVFPRRVFAVSDNPSTRLLRHLHFNFTVVEVERA